MKVMQVLPELNSGGVEKGTLEIADHLVKQGHEALVVSNGGRLVNQLESSGARHISMPVHKKSLFSLLQVFPFRRLLQRERPDVLHIRSRVPGWIAYLAWLSLPQKQRPRLVSTVHGFYSVNFYSAVMSKGEHVIAVSNSVKEYILKNYPPCTADKITVIHRGVSTDFFPRGFTPSAEWKAKWEIEHPSLQNKKLLLLPGRITRWKGQEDFIRLVAKLKEKGIPIHGFIVGETHAKKRAYLDELKALTQSLGLEREISFLGHRSDVREIMSISSITFSLSREPEAFGRVSLEAMALGVPVIGYDHGGVAEQLSALYPEGKVPALNESELFHLAETLIGDFSAPKQIVAKFTQENMCKNTMDIYLNLVNA